MKFASNKNKRARNRERCSLASNTFAIFPRTNRLWSRSRDVTFIRWLCDIRLYFFRIEILNPSWTWKAYTVFAREVNKTLGRYAGCCDRISRNGTSSRSSREPRNKERCSLASNTFAIFLQTNRYSCEIPWRHIYMMIEITFIFSTIGIPTAQVEREKLTVYTQCREVNKT